MAFIDKLKNTFSKITSSPILGLNTFGIRPTNALQSSTPTAVPTSGEANIFPQPRPQNVSSAPQTTFTPSQIQQSQIQQKFTDTIPTAPKPTVPASALSPDNTRESLLRARTELEKQFLERLSTPSDTLKQLGSLRNEIDTVRERQEKALKALRANPEGKGSAALEADIETLRGEQGDRLAKLAIREATLAGTLQLEKGEQAEILKNIKEISNLTQADQVGSLQTDKTTGEISAFFRDPSSGEISQQIVGKTGVQPDFDIRNIGGRTVAIDSNLNIVKDFGPSGVGSGSGTAQGFKFTPSDRQTLFAAGLGGDSITRIEEDINRFGFDAATSGLTQIQKNAVIKASGGTSRFLTTEYLLNNVFMGDARKNLENDAIAAGYGSKGFLGFGRSISQEQINSYLNDTIMASVETLREQGLTDQQAWKSLQASSKK